MEIDRRLLGDRSPRTASSYSNLASNLYEQGKYAEAQSLCEIAVRINRNTLGEGHPTTATTYNNLAMSLQAQGNLKAAEPLFRKALAINRRIAGDGNPATTNSANNLAVNLKTQGKFTEARDQWIYATQSFELGRLASAQTGLDRAAASTKAVPMHHLATLFARQGQLGEAWQRLEESLGRGLLDEFAAHDNTRMTTEERSRLSRLLVELGRLDRFLETPIPTSPSADDQKQRERMRAERDLAQIELDEFQSKLAKKYGPISGQVASLAQVQSILAPDAALVAWVDIVFPGQSREFSEHWGVVARARGVPAWFKLLGTGKGGQWTDDDIQLARELRISLQQRPLLPAGGVAPDTLIHRLRAQRLDPLVGALGATADGLPSARRLIVVSSDLMSGVPIEALLEPADSWTVSYAPSATVFAYLARLPKLDGQGGLLAVGDPLFELSPTTSSRSERFESLPGTRFEVEAVSRLFVSQRRRARVLTAIDASEPGMDQLATSGELGHFGFIHMATHGVIDESDPGRSAVILTQTGLPDPIAQVLKKKPIYDGRLTASEIERGWRLSAELVTLSACETARGQYISGEGFVGFTQALLMSGAHSVCLSFWKVDDVATALLMQRFYANLLGGRSGLKTRMPKAESLAEARNWLRTLHRDEVPELAGSFSPDTARSKDALRRQPAPPVERKLPGVDDAFPYAHPYYWSGFVLVGNPD